MIILTQSQVDQVKGESLPGFSIDPVALIDGTFCISERVLTDHAHESKHDFLSTLPKREVSYDEFQVSED